MPSDLALKLAEKYGAKATEVEAAPPPQPDSVRQYSDSINKYADEYGVPRDIAHALIRQESQGNPKAQSKAGAMGLGQLMPATAKEMGVQDAFDPDQNLRGSLGYFKKIYDATGDWELAKAAYNAGLGNVRKYDGIPPFKETQNYTKSIKNYQNEYKDTLEANPPKTSLVAPSPLAQGLLARMSEKGVQPSSTATQVGPKVVAMGKTNEDPLTGPLGETLALANSALDTTGVNFAKRQLGKLPILGTLGDNFNQGVDIIANKLITGRLAPSVAPEQLSQQNQQIIAQAESANPIASGLGAVAGALSPVGEMALVGKGANALLGTANTAGKIAKALKVGATTAAQGAGQNIVASDDPTAGSAIKQGLTDVAVASTLGAAGKAIKEAGKIGSRLGLGLPWKTKVPEYIASKLGVAPTVGALAKKNQIQMDLTSKKLNTTLQTLDDAGKRVAVDPEIVSKGDILKIAKEFERGGNREAADEAMDLARYFDPAKREVKSFSGALANIQNKLSLPVEKQNGVLPSVASRARELFWKFSKFTNDGRPGASIKSEAFYQKGKAIREALIKSAKGTPQQGQVENLLGELQTGIELSKKLEKAGKKPLINTKNALAAFIATSHPIPTAGAIAPTTTAGSTTLMQAGKQLMDKAIPLSLIQDALLGRYKKSKEQ